MEELTYLLTIVNIFKGIIDILKYFQEQKKKAHQKIGLIEKISPIKLYTKVKKSIEKNTNIRYNLIDEN